jgi:hypothetical protein
MTGHSATAVAGTALTPLAIPPRVTPSRHLAARHPAPRHPPRVILSPIIPPRVLPSPVIPSEAEGSPVTGDPETPQRADGGCRNDAAGPCTAPRAALGNRTTGAKTIRGRPTGAEHSVPGAATPSPSSRAGRGISFARPHGRDPSTSLGMTQARNDERTGSRLTDFPGMGRGGVAGGGNWRQASIPAFFRNGHQPTPTSDPRTDSATAISQRRATMPASIPQPPSPGEMRQPDNPPVPAAAGVPTRARLSRAGSCGDRGGRGGGAPAARDAGWRGR